MTEELTTEFKEIELKLRCVFCPAEGPLTEHYMGRLFEEKWTCPNCGITYYVGKEFWGGDRCLYINIDPGSEKMLQKTAEWEKAGHTYEPPAQKQKYEDLIKEMAQDFAAMTGLNLLKPGSEHLLQLWLKIRHPNDKDIAKMWKDIYNQARLIVLTKEAYIENRRKTPANFEPDQVTDYIHTHGHPKITKKWWQLKSKEGK